MGEYSGRALRDLSASGWSVTETVHPAGSVADWHAHGQGHLCLVVAGSLIDEDEVSTRECDPGCVLYFPPGVRHRDRFLDRAVRCLNLRPPDGAVGPGPVGTSPRVIAEPEVAWWAGAVFDRLRRQGGPMLPGPELEALIEAGARAVSPEAAPAPDWLQGARALIERSWSNDTRLGDVARSVGVSRFHLARRFRERYGCSVGEYVQRLRVTAARDLLLASDASLSEIAFRLGFSDQSHFTRVFHRLAGLPPARYRDAA